MGARGARDMVRAGRDPLVIGSVPTFDPANSRNDEQQVLSGGLIMTHPYRPGRIPVALVHRTASSPAGRAEIINELTGDPVLKGRFQSWLFSRTLAKSCI